MILHRRNCQSRRNVERRSGKKCIFLFGKVFDVSFCKSFEWNSIAFIEEEEQKEKFSNVKANMLKFT